MKKMKKNILLLFFMFLNVTLCLAQKKTEKLSTSDIAFRQTEKMVKIYGLNNDQKSKVYSINLSTANKLVDLKKIKMNESEYLADKSSILNTQRVEISKVLPSDQKSKFEADNRKYDAKNNLNKN
jgi:hypothetical protein